MVNEFENLSFDGKDDFYKLEKYLGPAEYNIELEMRGDFLYRKGCVNILTVGNFIGNVIKVECVFDETSTK
jgi:hypothetical protein